MKQIKRIISLCLVFSIIIGVLSAPRVVKAAATDIGISDITVNYDSESITVSTDFQAKEIYFSDKYDSKNPSKTDWKSVSTTTESSKKVAIVDISWMKKTISTIYIKSDAEKAVVYPIEINAEETTFEAYYSGIDTVKLMKTATADTKLTSANSFTALDSGYVYFTLGKGENVTQFTDLSKIEWKKGATGKWYSADKLTLNSYISMGSVLYFRLKAVDSTAITLKDGVYETNGSRASDDSKVTIARIARGPSVTINNSKYTIGLRSGMEYKVNDGDWINVSQAYADAKGKVGVVTLFDLYSTYTNNETNTKFLYDAGTGMKVTVRVAATSKKIASKETVKDLFATENPQKVALLDDENKENDLLKFTYKKENDSTSGLNITNFSKYAYDVAVVDKTDATIVTNNALDQEKIMKNKEISWKNIAAATYNQDGTEVTRSKVGYISNYKYEDIKEENRIIIYRLEAIKENTKTEEIEYRVVSKVDQTSFPTVVKEEVKD